MATETTAWDDLLSWQQEINEKDRQLLRTRAMREASSGPVQELRQIDLATAQPVGLSSLKDKIKAQGRLPSLSSSEKKDAANSEKELGNKAFQQQRYDQAIANYSKAIELDDKNAVYYINRAMAYLKLERYLEAERDSSSGLSLQPQHVKALFRRGMARRQLGKLAEARVDLELALSLASDNGTIKAELDAVIAAEQTESRTPLPEPTIHTASSETTRRLDVHFENTSYTGITGSPRHENPSPSAEASRIPDKQPMRPVEQNVTQPTLAVAPQSSGRFIIPKEPKTMTEFTRDWRMCRNRGNPVLYEYMKSINPKRYDDLFKAFLESDHLDQMIEILDQCYQSGQDIKEVLEGLLRVKRIDMLIMFLERKQREGLKRAFRRMEEDLGQEDQKLRKAWSVDS